MGDSPGQGDQREAAQLSLPEACLDASEDTDPPASISGLEIPGADPGTPVPSWASIRVAGQHSPLPPSLLPSPPAGFGLRGGSIHAGRDVYSAGRNLYVSITAPAQPEPGLRRLPAKSPVFAGRGPDLQDLLSQLAPDGPADGQPRVVVITGLPGVGKTEIALQAAHLALDNGWFPGGALYIDMRGYDEERELTAAAALDVMLRALKVPPQDILPEDHRSLQFASTTTARPILVIIDNVASAKVARQLLPGAGAVLVTSRHLLTSLPGQHIELPELDQAGAVEMLADLLRQRHAMDTRVTDQHEDAVSIAESCGKLPLALHIVGALLAGDESRPLASMARNLREASNRLDQMNYLKSDDKPGVRAAFDLSYRRLSDDEKRVLRLLPINFERQVTTEAVAAMAELDVGTAYGHLQELRDANLIKTGRPYGGHGRWAMHDLIRLYVSRLPFEVEDRRAAFFRLLLHYHTTTDAATRLLGPVPAGPAQGPFGNREEALEWLDAEYPSLNFLCSIFLPEPAFARTLTIDIILWLWRYFELRRHTDRWIEATTGARAIVHELGDREREADALTKLGGAYRQARRFDEAVSACHDAIGIQRELGNQHGMGVAMNNLAAALGNAMRFNEAAGIAREAAAIFQEAGDRHREGIAIAHLGSALTGSGKHAEGAAAFGQAAAIFLEVGDRRGEYGMLTNQGYALQLGGRGIEKAIDLHRRSATSLALAGDRNSEGMARVNLSAALIEAGEFEEAITAAGEAAAALRASKDPHGLGAALVNLGAALLEAARADEAATSFSEAAAAYRRSGDRKAEADARIRYGSALEEAGDRNAAIEAFRAVAAACAEAGDRRGEGRALSGLGCALSGAERFDEATTTLHIARAAARAAGDLEGEAKSLVFLGYALGYDRIDEGISAFREAAELLRRSGSDELAEMGSGALQAMEAGQRARSELKTWLARGRFEEVIADYRASKIPEGITQEIVGTAAADLGSQLHRAGRVGQAIPFLREAATAFEEAGARQRERAVRAELDAACQAQLDSRAAAQALRKAVSVAGSGGHDSQRALSAAIQEAYQRLGPSDARFFRLLSANSGPDISLRAAAILAVADREVTLTRLKEMVGLARRRSHWELFRRMSILYTDNDAVIAFGALRVLVEMGLVERDLAVRTRWRVPAAIRPFAARLGRRHAKQDLRGPVRTLLQLHYLAGTWVTSSSLDDGAIAPALGEVPGQATGLRWLAVEYQNLVATVREAADDELGAVIALDMTCAMFHIMSLTRRLDDAIELAPLARHAALRLHDRHAEAIVLRNLGSSLVGVGRPDEATSWLREALAIYKDLADVCGEGTTLTNLGGALRDAGQFAAAATTLDAALDIHRRHGRRFSEAVAQGSRGLLLEETGQPDEAIVALKDADLIYRKIGDQHHRSAVLGQLGIILSKAGRDDEAIKAYRRSATLGQLTGDLPLAVTALVRLAETYRAIGRDAEAGVVGREIADLGLGAEPVG